MALPVKLENKRQRTPSSRHLTELFIANLCNFSAVVMSNSRNDCRIYVGNLPPDIRTKDIQDLFYKFGKVTFVDLKNRRGPPFAFVEFEDPRYEGFQPPEMV
jgi:RNA recognition motif-containing protein